MRQTTSIRFSPSARPRVEPDDAPVGAASRSALSVTALRTVLTAVLLELCRYACGSPRSRLHQRAALRELDDRRLSDLGLTRREARTGRRDSTGGP